MKDLRIEKKRKWYPFDSNFVTGNFYNRGAEYRFQAKVFPEESHWGYKLWSCFKIMGEKFKVR